MKPDPAKRVAIMAPFPTINLREVIPSLPVDDPDFPFGMGGYCISSLVIERSKRGLATDVITLDPTADEPIMRWEGGKVRLWVIQRRIHGAMRDGYKRERYLLQQALRESNPDVCHANWTYEYGLAAVMQRDYPVVLTVHDHAGNCLKHLGPKYLPLYIMTQYVLSHAKQITTVSPYVSEYLEKKLGRNVTVIPNMLPGLAWKLGIEKIKFPKSNTSAGRTGPVKIISAVNWSRLKNTRRALQAFQVARRRCMEEGVEIQFTLIGPGLEQDGPAHEWAKKKRCDDGVFFCGNIHYQNAIQMLSGADLLLHTSLEESFGLPVAEAMIMGVPVMAALEAGGPKWLLDEGKYGVLFSGASTASIADAIISVVRHPQPEMTLKAHQRIAQICNNDEVLMAYENAYQRAVDYQTGIQENAV